MDQPVQKADRNGREFVPWPDWKVGDLPSLARYVSVPALDETGLPVPDRYTAADPDWANGQDIARSIYDSILGLGLKYMHEPWRLKSFGFQEFQPMQRVRYPAWLWRDSGGTCLDLAILYAAALKRAQIRPYIAILYPAELADPVRGEFEGHAFVIADLRAPLSDQHWAPVHRRHHRVRGQYCRRRVRGHRWDRRRRACHLVGGRARGGGRAALACRSYRRPVQPRPPAAVLSARRDLGMGTGRPGPAGAGGLRTGVVVSHPPAWCRWSTEPMPGPSSATTSSTRWPAAAVRSIKAGRITTGHELRVADLAPSQDTGAGWYISVVWAPGSRWTHRCVLATLVDALAAGGAGSVVRPVFARPATEPGRSLMMRYGFAPIGGQANGIWALEK